MYSAIGDKRHARSRNGLLIFRAYARCLLLVSWSAWNSILSQRNLRPSLNAATIAGEAGAAIRISPFASTGRHGPRIFNAQVLGAD